ATHEDLLDFRLLLSERAAVVRAHSRARERETDGHAIRRVDERVRKLTAHLRLTQRAETGVDPAALVGLQKYAPAVRPPFERPVLSTGQNEWQRTELGTRRQRRRQARPVDRPEARAVRLL